MVYSELPETIVRISGKDSRLFLQGQLTCDMYAINNIHASRACRLNGKGRVVANFNIVLNECLGDDEFLLNIPNSLVDIFIQDLTKYKLRAKVEFNYDKLLKSYGVVYAGGCELLPDSIDEVKSYTGVHIVKITEELFNVIATDIDMEEFVSLLSIKQQDFNLWQLYMINACQVQIQEATTARFLPNQLSLDDTSAVSFTKGCYLGQEIVARTKYLGKVKKYRLQKIDGITRSVTEGDKITDCNGYSGFIIMCALCGETYTVLALVGANE